MKIVDTDAFLDMPATAQLLYFHLSMRADDDGFINNPKKIMRMVGVGEDDFKILLAKKFVLPFESGVCVIKHWRVHNYIQSDRYAKTMYNEEMAKIKVKPNNVYTLDTECIQNGYAGKVRLGKSKSKVREKYIPKVVHKDEFGNACLEDQFETIRTNYKKYIKGTTRGHDTEFDNFKKKNPDYKEIIPNLYKPLVAEYAHRKKILENNEKLPPNKHEFLPTPKHFATWVNQRSWEAYEE